MLSRLLCWLGWMMSFATLVFGVYAAIDPKFIGWAVAAAGLSFISSMWSARQSAKQANDYALTAKLYYALSAAVRSGYGIDQSVAHLALKNSLAWLSQQPSARTTFDVWNGEIQRWWHQEGIDDYWRDVLTILNHEEIVTWESSNPDVTINRDFVAIINTAFWSAYQSDLADLETP